MERGVFAWKGNMSRKEARESVFKLVYERLVADQSNELSFDLLTQGFDADDMNYCRKLYDETGNKSEFLNSVIDKFSQAFKLERVYKVDLAILIVAVYEILYSDGLPHQVAANEAVELAKKYSTEKSYKYINGILSSVIKEKDIILEGTSL